MIGIALLALVVQQAPTRYASADAAPSRSGALSFQADTLLARAESLYAAGRLIEARRIAETMRVRRRDDPRVLLLLGRIHLDWPVFGRFTADSLFTRAGALDPTNPEPFYWLGHVGKRLMGDDGESRSRWGLERVIGLNPHYRDAWAMWLTLYRDEAERRRMLEVLAPHASDRAVEARRALLFVELRNYGEAEPLLRALIEGGRQDPAPRALLARALYEQGRDREAWAEYEAALALADADTAEVLWRQLRSIASPQERSVWTRTPPGGGEREAFLRLFWARREPDVRSRLNERIGEHFRRLVQAQRYFAVLHPSARYHHSAIYRARMGLGFSIPPDRGLEETFNRAYTAPCRADLPRAGDLRFAAGHTDVVDTARNEDTPNLEDGLDDRGRILARHGVPDERYIHSLDGETWCYVRPEGVFRVTFLRLGGDMVVRPVRAGEAESARHLLATDRPTREGRSLRFRFWPAAFRATADASLTELLLFADAAAAVGVLVDAGGREVARDSVVGGLVRLTAPPGRYALLLDAERDGAHGGYRGTIALPEYVPSELSVSSLLLASGAAAPNKGSMEREAAPGLRLRASEPMRFYAEVYGLDAADSSVRYEARYAFERAGGGFLGIGRRERATTIAFERTQPVSGRAIETLLVDPGRLPSGHYRLRLEITDRVRGVRAVSAMLEFDLR